MNNTIDIYDRKNPLSELRKVLGGHTTHENTENLVMVLCQRVEALENRISQLENKEELAYCQNCGDSPHIIAYETTLICCNCDRERDKVTG